MTDSNGAKTVSFKAERTISTGDYESYKLTAYVPVEVEGKDYSQALQKASELALNAIADSANTLGISKEPELSVTRLYANKPIRTVPQDLDF